jgi:fermentation-respiration switch protein FrsA (DUF1100 family)
MRALLVILALLGLALLLLWALQRHLIYLPSPGPVAQAREVIEGARDVVLETSDGLRLGAWYVPPRGGNREISVLVANGNAGDRSLRAPLAEALSRQGLGVLLFDYRGYGGNPGDPTEEGLARDARAAYEFLVEDEGIVPARVLLFGESLGAAVVARLATTHPSGGLVLRSPFTDLAAVGRVHYPFLPVGALLRDRFPVSDLLRRVEVPTTVVYGGSDAIVPPEQSRAVAEAAGGPKRLVVVEGADHNDPALLNGPEVVDAVVDLAGRVRRAL